MAWPEPVGVVTWMGRDIWRPRFDAPLVAVSDAWVLLVERRTSGIAAQITVPALIAAQPGDAESRRLYNAIPSPKVLAEFNPDAAEWGHCEGVALSRYDKVVYDWLDGILAS